VCVPVPHREDRFLGSSCPCRGRLLRRAAPLLAVIPRPPRDPSVLLAIESLPLPIRERTVDKEAIPPPGCFCEACQNKGLAGATVRKRVKTKDLETRRFVLQSLCFDMDANCGCRDRVCWVSAPSLLPDRWSLVADNSLRAERGRACADYSQRMVPHYLPTVNRYL
jgi:hypothetical protein